MQNAALMMQGLFSSGGKDIFVSMQNHCVELYRHNQTLSITLSTPFN